jgi:hypothetical protein
MLGAVSYMHGIQQKQQAVDDINRARQREEQIRNICTAHWEETKAKRSERKKPKRTRREAQAWRLFEEATKEVESVQRLKRLFELYQTMVEFTIVVFYKGALKDASTDESAKLIKEHREAVNQTVLKILQQDSPSFNFPLVAGTHPIGYCNDKARLTLYLSISYLSFSQNE